MWGFTSAAVPRAPASWARTCVADPRRDGPPDTLPAGRLPRACVRRRKRIPAMPRERALVKRLPRSIGRLRLDLRARVGLRGERELEAIDRLCPAAQKIDALPRSVGALALAHRCQREADVRRGSR